MLSRIQFQALGANPGKNRAENRKALQLVELQGFLFGVADGTRTHDDRNHNPGLYQLSYSHHSRARLYPRIASPPSLPVIKIQIRHLHLAMQALAR